MVPYLPAEALDLVVKVFSPMLIGGSSANDEKSGKAARDAEKGATTLLQKAAYRAISSVLQHSAAQSYDGQQVLNMWNLLREARQACEAPALKGRLLAISALLSLMEQRLTPLLSQPAMRQEYLQCLTTVLPEILFRLRDQSIGVREAARDCLRIAATTAIHGELSNEIVTLLSAGLAGLTPYSRASAVDALSRMLYEHAGRLAAALQYRLVQVVLLLLQDSDAAVYRAALKFTKVVVFVTPRDALTDHVPLIVKLFNSSHLTSAKMLVRKIVERLLRVLPEEVVLESFPKAHLPLLNYIQRLLARRGRPKSVLANTETGAGEDEAGQDADMGDAAAGPTETWDEFQGDDEVAEADSAPKTEEPVAGRKRARASKEPPTSAVAGHESVQALLDAWEAESGSGDEGGRRKSSHSGKRKRDRDSAEASTTWIREDQDVPLDFMSADAAHSVLTTRPPQQKRRRATGAADAQSRAEALRREGLRFAADGRLVVDEEAATNREEEKKLFDIGTDTKKVKPLSRLAAQRHARAQAKIKGRVEKRGTHQIKGLDNFKPGKKGGQGDAKRKGTKLEPFAYVRLNPKIQKEKYRRRATQTFERVVKGAKSGILKGLKGKARDLKKKRVKDSRKQKRMKKPHKPGAR